MWEHLGIAKSQYALKRSRYVNSVRLNFNSARVHFVRITERIKGLTLCSENGNFHGYSSVTVQCCGGVSIIRRCAAGRIKRKSVSRQVAVVTPEIKFHIVSLGRWWNRNITEFLSWIIACRCFPCTQGWHHWATTNLLPDLTRESTRTKIYRHKIPWLVFRYDNRRHPGDGEDSNISPLRR